MSTRIILVRHARSTPDRNAPEPEWPLSEEGLAQAAALVPVLQRLRVEAVAASPFRRAIGTVAPYAEARGLPVRVHEGLRERRLTEAWIEDLVPELERMHADLAYGWPDGETGHDAAARIAAALRELAAEVPGRTLAAASHGAVICHLLKSLGSELDPDYWRRVRNPHLFHFEVDGEAIVWLHDETLDGSDGVRR